MKTKHYYDKNNISRNNKASLENLVDECDIIHVDKGIDSLINKEDFKSVICVFDDIYGEICGFATVVDEGDGVYLSELFVHPSERGRGYATELIKEVKKYAKSLHYSKVSLVVPLERDNAKNLYLKNRFLFARHADNSNSVLMEMYTSNEAYFMGGMLYQLEKKYGRENVVKGIELEKQNEDFEKFYPYFKSIKKDDMVRRVFESEKFAITANVIEKLETTKETYAFTKIFDEYVSKVAKTDEEMQDVKNILFATTGFEKHEEVRQKLKNEKKEEFNK